MFSFQNRKVIFCGYKFIGIGNPFPKAYVFSCVVVRENVADYAGLPETASAGALVAVESDPVAEGVLVDGFLRVVGE